ncbi:MAG: MBL fold metallo-hydrolase [Butyrivibrio sp.]|uniref:MBL fold metallo-hydrolase n=1 Tax=Butyrivibrio sp. TaxID=28121 RepID=UPI0025FA019D|nr:MBL fold metallo-hydrolase [Butyrivibrio sp.]MCR5771066.1 MBL fold metallo-hydrolase [Butyrivibrio sp.]
MNSNIKVGSATLGPIATNCYFVFNDRSAEENVNTDEPIPCIFFDPADMGEMIYEKLKEKNIKIELILLTHGHFDHMAGADELRRLSGAPIWCWEKEADVCQDPDVNLSYDFIGKSITIKPDKYLKDNEIIEAAGLKLRLIGTPGHTVGSCCYSFDDNKVLISGDTLFEGSVGRTDFPGGSSSTLVKSVKEKLFGLPDDTIVYPGHGAVTTIGDEKLYNPFVR